MIFQSSDVAEGAKQYRYATENATNRYLVCGLSGVGLFCEAIFLKMPECVAR